VLYVLEHISVQCVYLVYVFSVCVCLLCVCCVYVCTACMARALCKYGAGAISDIVYIGDYGLTLCIQVMVHTEFDDDRDRYPYNRNDGVDIDVVLNVCGAHHDYHSRY